MRYTVGWQPAAERGLAALWTVARDRAAVTQAAHRIEELLVRNPEDAGESRTPDGSPGRRILFDPPLAVVFSVSESVREVRVLDVGWSSWRKKG